MRGCSLAMLLVLAGGCHRVFGYDQGEGASADGSTDGALTDADAGPGDGGGDQPGDGGCGAFGAGCPVIAAMTGGRFHSCVLTGEGGIWCWGANAAGQLGDGTTTDRADPVQVKIGSGLPAVRLAAGYEHTCAIDSEGAVWCWGSNGQNQVGGPLNQRTVVQPYRQALPQAADQLATGRYHSCARAGGTVYCWGSNGMGQLGDGTTQDSASPRQVADLTGVSDLSCGYHHCCAVAAGTDQTDDGIRCWGDNSSGQLGCGDAVEHDGSVRALLDERPAAVVCGGEFSCAITAAKQVWCWGNNGIQQLAQGYTSWAEPAPVQVEQLGSVAELVAGQGHACARGEDRSLRCWGYDRYGQIGLGENTYVERATVVEPGWTVDMLGAGAYHTCARAADDGSLWCWGANASGQVGNGRFARRAAPAPVGGLGQVVGIASGGYHSCAVLADGTARCWGYNAAGQLGDSSEVNRPAAAQVVSLAGADQIGGGGFHSCAVDANGGVHCWGASWRGQIGLSSGQSSVPVPVVEVGGAAVAVTGGHDHSCALMVDGTVRCWGGNGLGQLGVGSSGTFDVPVTVNRLTAAKRADARGASSCAIEADGSLWCWGDNRYGQLGDGTRVQRAEPVQVEGVAEAIDVAVGGRHACAVLAGGGVRCWGDNSLGQLGDGTQAWRDGPVSAAVPEASAIAAGWEFTCALDQSGAVWCWGDNSCHQVGVKPSSGPQPVPQRVSGSTVVTRISAGWAHVCAATATGEVVCWGDAHFGQLGDGYKSDTWVPVRVIPR